MDTHASPGQSTADAAKQIHGAGSGRASECMVPVYRGSHCDRSGGAARIGAWPWQDNCRSLPCWLQRNGTSCGAARNHRDRFAYCRRLCSRGDYSLRFALHRAGATLSVARRSLGYYDCGPRLLYASAPIDWHNDGSLSFTGCSGSVRHVKMRKAFRRKRARLRRSL